VAGAVICRSSHCRTGQIHYTPEVTWQAYSSVLRLAEVLKSELALHDAERLSARDMIDIQSFIWVAGAYDR